jgi:hypothetical protein
MPYRGCVDVKENPITVDIFSQQNLTAIVVYSKLTVRNGEGL